MAKLGKCKQISRAWSICCSPLYCKIMVPTDLRNLWPMFYAKIWYTLFHNVLIWKCWILYAKYIFSIYIYTAAENSILWNNIFVIVFETYSITFIRQIHTQISNNKPISNKLYVTKLSVARSALKEYLLYIKFIDW
jgi:hypothetical protein